MLWDYKKLLTKYDSIKENHHAKLIPVLIFVASDIDSLSSCRMLTALFRSDNVQYKIKPVSSYSDIDKANKEFIEDNDDLHSIIFLNCGGRVNVRKLIPSIDVREDLTCYIFDCHRPICLKNIYADHQIIVCNDGSIQIDDLPSDVDSEDDEDESQAMEEEDEEEEEERSESESDSSKSRAGAAAIEVEEEEGEAVEGEKEEEEGEEEVEEKEKEEGEDGEEEKEKEDDNNNNNSNINEEEGDGEEKEKVISEGGEEEMKEEEEEINEENNERKEENEEEEEEENDENGGDMTNKSVQQSVLGKRKRSSQRIKVLEYMQENYYGIPTSNLIYQLCQDLNKASNDMLWLTIVSITYHYLENHIDHVDYTQLVLDMQTEVISKNNDSRSVVTTEEGTEIAVADEGKISVEDKEYRFMLLRHWNLYDAMYNSDFVASRMNIWTSKGKKNLSTFFAKLGIKLEDAKQRYSFMSQKSKASLQNKIADVASEYELTNFSYGSFSRVVDFKTTISAADIVHIAQALIECSDNENDEWLSCFNKAYDFLLCKRKDLFDEGLGLSKRLQSAIIRQGSTILEKKLIKKPGPFRYTLLNALAEGDLRMFTQPLALAKLAQFIIKANRASKKWQGSKACPFIICALNTTKSTYMIVGSSCADRDESVEKTVFGMAFKAAAEQINVKYKNDSFDTCVMEIEKYDIDKFIEALHEVMIH